MPRDVNQRAHLIVQMGSGEAEEPKEREKNPAAVALGKLGGSKGGLARAKALSERRRREIAKKAARARWGARNKRK
jgi:hypothetical protein